MSVLAITTYSFACDFPGCTEVEEFIPGWNTVNTLPEARKMAKREGWRSRRTQSGQEDLCPDHSEEAAG